MNSTILKYKMFEGFFSVFFVGKSAGPDKTYVKPSERQTKECYYSDVQNV